MDEDIRLVIEEYISTIKDVCTSPMTCHRIKRVEITWQFEKDDETWVGHPKLTMEFIDAPMAKEVKE